MSFRACRIGRPMNVHALCSAVQVVAKVFFVAGAFGHVHAQDECADDWQQWSITSGADSTQAALGVDLADNAYVATVTGERITIKILNASGEVDLDVGQGVSQGDPDFATNSLGVTFLTFAQIKEGAPGEGREIFLSDNRGQSFRTSRNISSNRVDEFAPRIALDRSGEPHLVWARSLGVETYVVYWHASLAAPVIAAEGTFPVIFVDQNRTVHLVYSRGNDVYHNTNASGEFDGERPVVTTPSVVETSASVGVDSDGMVLVCYESQNSLYFANAPHNRTFLPPRLLDIGGVVDPKMRVRRGGKLAIVYSKAGDIFSIIGQSDVLNLPPRRITETDEIESAPSLDIDLLGNLHVSFVRDGAIYYINNACAPGAEFAAVPPIGQAPLAVRFSDLSSGEIDVWNWDFGDGETSTSPDPVHVYENPGKYTVRLDVIAAGGRTATITKEDFISVQTPDFSMTIPDQIVTPGQKDVWFPVLADHKRPIQGFQVMATYDPNFLVFKEYTLDFTKTQTLAPEFLEVNVFPTYVEVGCIFDFVGPFDGRVLGSSNGGRLINLIFDVQEDAAVGARTVLRMLNNLEISRIFNIFTVNGFSVLPALGSSTITITDSLTEQFVRGDVDDNGEIQITDGISVLNYLFLGGAVPRCLDAADFDDDGSLVLTDAISILNFLFLGGPAPRVPFPGLGSDGSPDGLPACRDD